MDGDHVVSVHPDARESVALGPVGERDAGLHGAGDGDRPVVVLAEEHHGGLVGSGEHHGLMDVAFGAGAVAEVDHDGSLGLRGVAGRSVRECGRRRELLVALDAHRVADRMRGLRREDQGVEVEVGVLGVPAAVGDAAELAQQLGQVHVAGQGDAVLAVGGKDVVLRLAGPAGADLGGLLAGERHPQGQLALPLQRGGLHVEAADLGHVGIESAQFLRVKPLGVFREHGVGAERAVGSEELHHRLGRIAQAGFGFRLEPVLNIGSVELGRGQMCGAHTVSLLAASECAAIAGIYAGPVIHSRSGIYFGLLVLTLSAAGWPRPSC